MELSLFLAQLLGAIYVSVGLGILNNQKRYKALMDEMMDSASFLYFGGILALCFGFSVVTFHNVWVQDWPVLITILGWLALIKGVLLIICPQVILDFSKGMLKNLQYVGLGTLLFGLVLAYYGFVA